VQQPSASARNMVAEQKGRLTEHADTILAKARPLPFLACAPPPFCRPEVMAPLRDFLLGDIPFPDFSAKIGGLVAQAQAQAQAVVEEVVAPSLMPLETWRSIQRVLGIRTAGSLLLLYRETKPPSSHLSMEASGPVKQDDLAKIEDLVSNSPWFLHAVGEAHARVFLELIYK